jgi:[NiFe] hydrogenase diaphorase moiety large subunit
MRSFPEAYEARLQPGAFVPRVTLQEALADAVQAQGRRPIAEAV